MNIRQCLLLIASLFILQLSFCQTEFTPGLMLNLSGDTISGFIKYAGKLKKQDSVAFKVNDNDQVHNYGVPDIKGFAINGVYFHSAIVKTEITSNYTNDLESYKELRIETDTAFLETIIEGPKSLYYCANRFGKNQFYIKSDTSFELLVYKRYLAEARNNSFTTDITRENNQYIGQLQIYLNDCQEIEKKLKSLNYQLKSLEKLFLHYYDCVNKPLEKHNKSGNTQFEKGVMAGLSVTKIKFNGYISPYLTKCDFKASPNFIVGGFFNIISPLMQQHISLCNELTYTKFDISGHYLDYTNENDYRNIYTKIGFSFLKINTLIRYTYSVKKFKPYLNVGFSNAFCIANKNDRRDEIRFYSSNSTENQKAIASIRKYEFGSSVGLGTKYQNLFFELRYERESTISNLVSLGSTTNRGYVVLGYFF